MESFLVYQINNNNFKYKHVKDTEHMHSALSAIITKGIP
jgi:hypothetical protein